MENIIKEFKDDIIKIFKTDEAIERLAQEEIKSGVHWNEEHIEIVIRECNTDKFNVIDIAYQKEVLQDERVLQIEKELQELSLQENEARQSDKAWKKFVEKLNGLCEKRSIIAKEIKRKYSDLLFFAE